MKKSRFLFAIVGFGALTLGLSYADEPSRPPAEQVLRQNHPTSDPSAGPPHGNQAHGKIDQKEEKPSKPKEDSHDSKPKDDSHPSEKRRPAGPAKSLVKLPSEKESPQLELKKPVTGAKEGPWMSKTGKPHERLAKPPVGNEAIAPRPGVVRSRGATAALVGRVLITSNAKYSAGPLEGAAIKRYP